MQQSTPYIQGKVVVVVLTPMVMEWRTAMDPQVNYQS